MPSRLENLFGGAEFWVARGDINRSLEWVRHYPRDCRGFTWLKDDLIAKYGGPNDPYLNQMSDALGQMSMIHSNAVEKANDIHIPPCQYSEREQTKGPFDAHF